LATADAIALDRRVRITVPQLTLDQLNTANATAFVAALGDTFEHSPWVAERAAAARPFADMHALLAAMVAAVKEAPAEQQLALLRAHPDLAGKAARAGTLTRESTQEQASAGLDQLSEAEFQSFQGFNANYRQRFDIPFIVCVRRHTKDSILRQFARRLENEKSAEIAAALTEVFRIAALRLDQRIADANLGLDGRLSTHVLDTHAGRPARGLWLALRELSDHDAPRLIVRTCTNPDGRTDAPLIAGRPVPIGRYELLFAVGDYYAEQGLQMPDPPFLDVVPVRFAVAEAEGHYHVPLLMTPWSYSTYRGS
jgi:2-oxo-4-hydroxy-4-carboxy-5-ureidoimidazoline decarboxylase